MSIQKQKRLLSYKPAIVIATPGRLWELMDEHQDEFLVKGLPMIDVLVLDEADRMVADGHFKELKFILNHIYQKRVFFKKQQIESKKAKKPHAESDAVRQQLNDAKKGKSGEKVGKNLEATDKLRGVDPSKIVTLDGDDEGNEMLAQGNIIIDEKMQAERLNNDVPLEQDDEFNREY